LDRANPGFLGRLFPASLGIRVISEDLYNDIFVGSVKF